MRIMHTSFRGVRTASDPMPRGSISSRPIPVDQKACQGAIFMVPSLRLMRIFMTRSGASC
jgi:hypothetical protein